MPGLGGLRHPRPDSTNTGLRNAGFPGYADYMQTATFRHSLDRCVELAKRERVVLMCAEAVSWRCHRSLIADALLVGGIQVSEITSAVHARPHLLTPWAQVIGTHVMYPGATRAPQSHKIDTGTPVKPVGRGRSIAASYRSCKEDTARRRRTGDLSAWQLTCELIVVGGGNSPYDHESPNRLFFIETFSRAWAPTISDRARANLVLDHRIDAHRPAHTRIPAALVRAVTGWRHTPAGRLISCDVLTRAWIVPDRVVRTRGRSRSSLLYARRSRSRPGGLTNFVDMLDHGIVLGWIGRDVECFVERKFKFEPLDSRNAQEREEPARFIEDSTVANRTASTSFGNRHVFDRRALGPWADHPVIVLREGLRRTGAIREMRFLRVAAVQTTHVWNLGAGSERLTAAEMTNANRRRTTRWPLVDPSER